MSAASAAERSTGRRIADAVLDAVAAPLSAFDQSTSYSRYLEQTLLAEGKRRLVECLDRELAADLHEHHRSANRTLVTGFSQMELSYQRWRDGSIEHTLRDLEQRGSHKGLNWVGARFRGEARPAYEMAARRFVRCYQLLVDLDHRRQMEGAGGYVAEELAHEIPPCLEAFAEMEAAAKRLLEHGVADAELATCARRFRLQCVHLWLWALGRPQVEIEHLANRVRAVPRPPPLTADLDEEPGHTDVAGAFEDVARDWLDLRAPLHPRLPLHLYDTMMGVKSAIEAAPQPTVGSSGSPTDRQAATRRELAFRLLFPGVPWRDGRTRPKAARSPVELDQLKRIRSVAVWTFREFDECDNVNPWSLGRLAIIDRRVLHCIFTELIERCPEPLPMERIYTLVQDNLAPRDRFEDEHQAYVKHHLQTVVAGFSEVVSHYHRVYRASLVARRLDDGEPRDEVGDDEHLEHHQFGWTRLWPAIWSDESNALWTDRDEMQGGVPLPVTFRLVFNRKRGSEDIDSVMLVPLFPIKRTLDAAPLREFLDYMQSGAVALLPSDAQVARNPYRLAAAAAQVVRLARLGRQVLGLGWDLVSYHVRKSRDDDPPAGSAQENEPPDPWLALWNRRIRWFVRLGSQRHGPLDQLWARGLRALPRLLKNVAGPGADDRRAQLEARLALMLTPVPHLMWCDTLRLMHKAWQAVLEELFDPGADHRPVEAVERLMNRAKGRTCGVLTADALRTYHTDGRHRRARESCAWLSGLLVRLWDMALNAHAHAHAQRDPSAVDRHEVRRVVEQLEIFLLASLYLRPARPEPDLAVPARLLGRVEHYDRFTITARAHLGGRRGLDMRLRALTGMALAPLRLTPGDVRALRAKRDLPDPEDGVADWVRGFVRRWHEELDALAAELAGALRRVLDPSEQEGAAEAAPAEPPTAASLVADALRRSGPSTYITLRDLFADAVRWPLPPPRKRRR